MSHDARLLTFARAIAQGDLVGAAGLLAGAPELALGRLAIGATRHASEEYFLDEIDHHMYAGDTALHIAAAAYEAGLARELVNAGAIVAAANRRVAEPLHYVVDKNGTTPLHRAVRNRCAAAVEALLDVGADPHSTNRSGSTAIQLARCTTGRGGSGSAHAKAAQQEILGLLQACGRG